MFLPSDTTFLHLQENTQIFFYKASELLYHRFPNKIKIRHSRLNDLEYNIHLCYSIFLSVNPVTYITKSSDGKIEEFSGFKFCWDNRYGYD